jgi:hypothetical protein
MMALTESRKMKCESAWNLLIEDWLWEEQAPQIQKVSDQVEHLKPTKKDLMISKIISGAACLTELTSNPKSFYNCPDLHGGVPDASLNPPTCSGSRSRCQPHRDDGKRFVVAFR